MGKKIDGGTVVVDGKGNMKQLNKELDKTSKGFNTLDKNSRSADRGMKGASNMSSNDAFIARITCLANLLAAAGSGTI